MRRFMLYMLLCLFVGVALVNLIQRDPGYLLLEVGDWQIETSFWLALVLLVVAAWALWMLQRVISSTLRVPLRLRAWLGLRSARGAHQRTDKGFTAFLEGRWDVAEKTLKRDAGGHEATVLHPIFAAVAAQRRGDRARSQALLEEAEGHPDMHPDLIWLTRAELNLEAGEVALAAKDLECLSASASKLPAALRLRGELARVRGAWPDVLALLPDCRRQRAASSSALELWEREAFLGTLAQGRLAANELLALWKQLSASLSAQDSPLLAPLLKALLDREAWEEIQKLVLDRLGQFPEPVAMEYAGRLPQRYGNKARKVLERWQSADRDGTCHVALARRVSAQGDAAAASALWEEAWRLGPKPEVAIEWARLLRHQGDGERAKQLERSAQQMMLASLNTPALGDSETA